MYMLYIYISIVDLTSQFQSFQSKETSKTLK